VSNFNKFIDELNSDELEIFEKDMKEGIIQRYIDRKKEFFKLKDKTCPVCGNMVQDDCFVLIFGEASIRKKAHFCGVDCMDYFVHKYLAKNNKIKKPISNPE